MKKSSKMIMALLCLIVSSVYFPVAAQKSDDQIKDNNESKITERTLLWEIKGNGIKKSYLYGTFHLLPQADFQLKDKVKKAFDKTEQLALEFDMDDPNMQMEMMQNVAMKNGVTISSLLNEKEKELLEEKLKTALGTGLQAFDTWKPFMVQSLILGNFIDGKPASFEGTFVAMAQKAEKEIFGLETIGYQLGVFDEISYKIQADWLKEMLNSPEATKDAFKGMISIYKNGSPQELYDVMASEYDSEAVLTAMLDKRNKNWIPEIGKLASEKSTFFGVGAGHLAGENGVINLLRKAGYKVKPVQ